MCQKCSGLSLDEQNQQIYIFILSTSFFLWWMTVNASIMNLTFFFFLSMFFVFHVFSISFCPPLPPGLTFLCVFIWFEENIFYWYVFSLLRFAFSAIDEFFWCSVYEAHFHLSYLLFVYGYFRFIFCIRPAFTWYI